MSLRIRLKQLASQQHYRIVLIDSRRPRDGRMQEQLGYYSKHGKLSIDLDRLAFWVSRGAQPSEPMVRILDECGVLDVLTEES